MIVLSIGTNIGNKIENLREALRRVDNVLRNGVSDNKEEESRGVDDYGIETISKVYESEPWGFSSDNGFLNIAVGVRTKLSVQELLVCMQEIEREMGRVHKTKNADYADRIIDIDIISYNDDIYESDVLVVPHIHIGKRKFVLLPLRDISPKWVHPKSGRSIDYLIAHCEDTSHPIATTLLL